MPEQKKSPKMFEPQEKDPERMLPAGHPNAALKLFYILILNAVVFGMVYAIVYIFFWKDSFVARTVAEIVTLLTLITSFLYWARNRNRG